MVHTCHIYPVQHILYHVISGPCPPPPGGSNNYCVLKGREPRTSTHSSSMNCCYRIRACRRSRYTRFATFTCIILFHHSLPIYCVTLLATFGDQLLYAHSGPVPIPVIDIIDIGLYVVIVARTWMVEAFQKGVTGLEVYCDRV